MGKWKIERDSRKEKGMLGSDTAAGANYLASEKAWSKNMGMLGAIAVPLYVASVVASGGGTLTLLPGMLAAGVGSVVGAKLGEEAREAVEKKGFQWGEDKYSKGENIREGKFNKKERQEVKSSMFDLASDLDSGMIKDAAISAALYGIKVGGKDLVKGGKGYLKGLATGDLALKEAGSAQLKESVFGLGKDGLVNEGGLGGAKTAFKDSFSSFKDGRVVRKADREVAKKAAKALKNKAGKQVVANLDNSKQVITGNTKTITGQGSTPEEAMANALGENPKVDMLADASGAAADAEAQRVKALAARKAQNELLNKSVNGDLSLGAILDGNSMYNLANSLSSPEKENQGV